MNSPLSTLAAGAMAAATALGSVAQSIGSGASHAFQALPSVSAGGAQAIAHGVGLVEKPAKAMAAGIPQSTVLTRTAAFLSRALPVVTIGASTLSGARIVDDRGAGALVTTKEGRGAVLGAVGGALLLVPTPVTQLAAAGVLGAVAANHFGGLDGLDAQRPVSVTPPG